MPWGKTGGEYPEQTWLLWTGVDIPPCRLLPSLWQRVLSVPCRLSFLLQLNLSSRIICILPWPRETLNVGPEGM